MRMVFLCDYQKTLSLYTVIYKFLLVSHFCIFLIISSGGDWTISGNRLDLHDTRILAMAAAQDRLLEDEYDEYTATNNNAAAFCRSIFLIVSFCAFYYRNICIFLPLLCQDNKSVGKSNISSIQWTLCGCA